MGIRARLAWTLLAAGCAMPEPAPPVRAAVPPTAAVPVARPSPVPTPKPTFDASAWSALGKRYGDWRRALDSPDRVEAAIASEADSLLGELSKFALRALPSRERTHYEVMQYRLSAFVGMRDADATEPAPCQSTVSPARYRAAIYQHVTLALSPDEIRAIGESELATIDRELREHSIRLGYSGSLPQVFEKIRRDPTLRFASGQAARTVLQKAQARALEQVKRVFHEVPKTAAEITPRQAKKQRHWSPGQALGFYVAAENEEPATFFVNSSDLTTQPRLLAEVLAFHETVPGHHLQSVSGGQNGERISAFEEGWATYAERLADELGLYDDDLSRLGMLTFQSWRASRLVADTGVNVFCWTRAQAKQYLREHTLLAERALDQEVQRLVDWPAHQVGYMIGAREIRLLRERAKRQLGARFDSRDFHAVILGHGQVPLATLRRRVAEWIKEKA